jgi:hypothetical protein
MLVMPFFLTRSEAILLALVVLIWFLSEAIGSGIIPVLRRSGGAIKKKDRSSNIVLRVLTYISVIIAILFNIDKIAMLPN